MLHTWIRSQRKAAGLTQEEVAEKLKMTQSQLSRIEGGQITITVELLQRLADVIGFDAGEAARKPVKAAA